MKRALIVSAAVVALGSAAPAHAADPNAMGTYTLRSGNSTGTWVATPCADDRDHCIHISSSGMVGQQPWEADAFWSVGSWILRVELSNAITCKDGSDHPGVMTYSWDAATLHGWAGIFNNGVCGQGTASLAAPFTLTKIA